ncbi:hypothetical protein BLA29_003433 [Euroglyphus maynei]|uniref:Uncharacterized protein n=1 Tax=Euroglyphus maynei TaxID=6958 RepID=A0A1Y3B6D6_EURMA|nr:hypothetical protein BLA29_003433 [Euroglyphus maynei]
MPKNFVIVIPDMTELPISARPYCARKTLVGSFDNAVARAICAQNSTDIPMLYRLTNDTALSEIPQKYIKPNIFNMILKMVTTMVNDVIKSNDKNRNVTINIANKAKTIFFTDSVQMKT